MAEETKEINSVIDEGEDKKILHRLRVHRIIDVFMVRLFFVALATISLIALVPTLRPSYSETERRELNKFPKFTFESLVSGEYFDGISLWFSDTFPFRDTLVAINGSITGYSGGKVQIYGDVETGDEIPDIPSVGDGESVTQNTEELPQESTPSDVSGEASSQESGVASSQESGGPSSTAPAEPTGPAVEQLGAILLVDDSAYEYYNFVQSTADAYSANISRAADMLLGRANVYDVIVPTSMGITAPKDIVVNVNTSDQQKAMEYMYGIMSNNVKKVSVYDTLMQHRDEYLYFRTDHHWTTLGAYYTYIELMKTINVAPTPLESFTRKEFSGFLGSFYNDSGKNPRLGANPDTVIAYVPTQTNTIRTILAGGVVNNYSIVSDGNLLGTTSKYLSFLSGDRPLGIIENPQITDESKVCLIIKESFGNAFVPFLVGNYKTVYVVDYRYISQVEARKLSQFVDETGTKDVIFLNNISATRNKALVDSIGSFIG